MSQLLLVEDDASLGATLQERLRREGYEVLWARTLAEAEKILRSQNLDLAVLDVGLPDGSGFDLAPILRRDRKIPFLFMTAASDAENRLQGFELGAEEFIPKPFHLKELLLRVRHVLENHRAMPEVRIQGAVIDFHAMMLRWEAGETYNFSQKENDVLRLLIASAPRVISREEILNQVWGEDKFPSNRTVDNIIVRLRQVLGEKNGVWIRSVRGVGYQWIHPDEVSDG